MTSNYRVDSDENKYLRVKPGKGELGKGIDIVLVPILARFKMQFSTGNSINLQLISHLKH